MTASYAMPQPGPDRTVAELARRFPGASVWLGESTGHWWALARDGAGCYRLIQAESSAVLVHRLDEVGAWQAVPRRGYSRESLAAVPPRGRSDSAHVGSATAVHRLPHPRRRASRRRGWLRIALSGLVAS